MTLQPYCYGCEFAEAPGDDGKNVDVFRRRVKGETIVEWQSDYMGVGGDKLNYLPWLAVDYPTPIKPVVIHRSDRYHNNSFPWWTYRKGSRARPLCRDGAGTPDVLRTIRVSAVLSDAGPSFTC